VVQVHVPPLSTESPPGNRGAFDSHGPLFGYAFGYRGGLTVVALGYFYRKVPETKGRSLREPEQQLPGSAVG
jgi:hypothetical protein